MRRCRRRYRCPAFVAGSRTLRCKRYGDPRLPQRTGRDSREDFEKAGAKTILCTDDGTLGQKGFVTNALEQLLLSECPDCICACGPLIMLKKVAEIAAAHSIPCQVSLEERMACGVGACLGCAVQIRREGKEQYLHVCKDGPVFYSEEVVF